MTTIHPSPAKRGLSRLAAVFLSVSLLLTTAYALTVPEPTEDFYVGDFAGVLSAETEDDIVLRNRTLHQQTGAEIVVVTVEFLDGADIEQYAYSLFNSWGIGSAEKNNGVLLLLAIGEDDYWCVQGTGLEQTLDSGTIGDILATYLEPDFAAGDYDAGVQKTFDILYQELEDIYHSAGGTAPGYPSVTAPQPPVQQPVSSPLRFWGVFRGLMLIVGLVVLFSLLASWNRAFGRRRTVVYRTPRPPLFWGGRRYDNRPPPPPPRGPNDPPPPASGGFGGFGGWGRTGGGSTRGGGAGRSSGGGSYRSSSSSRPRSSSSRSSGSRSFGGGGRSGGGGTRGGGAGRGR